MAGDGRTLASVARARHRCPTRGHGRENHLRHPAGKARLGLMSSEANPSSLASSMSGLDGVNPLQKGGRRVWIGALPHRVSSQIQRCGTQPLPGWDAQEGLPSPTPPFSPPGTAAQGRDSVGWGHKHRQPSEALAINHALPRSNI